MMELMYLLAILYNTYLLVKLLKYLVGIQLVICLQLINTLWLVEYGIPSKEY